ncbi:class I SAM-dependent methyltransferase [Candidatus Gracilibacteria bacterium]|nr:class I SAM-dependent methyltransferase [Candidatus Gracilibacteria bacterium]
MRRTFCFLAFNAGLLRQAQTNPDDLDGGGAWSSSCRARAPPASYAHFARIDAMNSIGGTPVECIQGTRKMTIDSQQLAALAAAYPYTWLDLGTGDGRFVQHMARTLPRTLLIGVDACRENLRERSRRSTPNTLFAIANALALPAELDGLVQRVSINFPWGSLLEALLEGDAHLLNGLRRVTRPTALLEIRLNGGALLQSELAAEEGAARVRQVLNRAGWRCGAPTYLAAQQLKDTPSSWAQRLAHGPHPWAISLRAVAIEIA